jgi:hypothetical protein
MSKTLGLLSALALGAALAFPTAGMNQEVSPDPRHDGADEQEAAAPISDANTFPSMPRVRMAELRSAGDAEPIDRESLETRAREWVRQSEVTADPLSKARYLLAAANAVLSYEPAPALTYALLELGPEQIDGPGRLDNAESARRVIMEATGWIEKAESLLTAQRPADVETIGNGANDSSKQEDTDGERQPVPGEVRIELVDWERLTQVSATLSAFSQAFSAYLTPSEEPSAYRKSREAATALAPVLEDGDPAVAAAAKLWQSALRSREEDPTPALLRLDHVNVTADPRTQPYALFSRLLRCRLVARHGSLPAGMALLLQLEERCHEWFSDDQRRDEALRVVALTRLRLLRAWQDGAEAGGNDDEVVWCARQARQLLESHFEDEAMVMPLAPTVPLLIDAPPATAPMDSARPAAD